MLSVSFCKFLQCLVFLLTSFFRGILQFISLFFLSLSALSPDQTAYFIGHWEDPAKTTQGLLQWPTDFSQDIQPVPCHSHNDYWRTISLHSALQAGCTSVEADVWLINDYDSDPQTPDQTRLCRSLIIKIFIVFFYITHFLQPLNSICFQLLKHYYTKTIDNIA
jgi:hypothetical protein